MDYALRLWAPAYCLSPAFGPTFHTFAVLAEFERPIIRERRPVDLAVTPAYGPIGDRWRSFVARVSNWRLP
jgi:hypothetical protein